MWSVLHNAMVCEIQAWVSFFDDGCGKRFNLKEKGGVYSDLHRHLCERAAGSVRASWRWAEWTNPRLSSPESRQL